jgi:hypothetical protein
MRSLLNFAHPRHSLFRWSVPRRIRATRAASLNARAARLRMVTVRCGGYR